MSFKCGKLILSVLKIDAQVRNSIKELVADFYSKVLKCLVVFIQNTFKIRSFDINLNGKEFDSKISAANPIFTLTDLKRFLLSQMIFETRQV